MEKNDILLFSLIMYKISQFSNRGSSLNDQQEANNSALTSNIGLIWMYL